MVVSTTTPFSSHQGSSMPGSPSAFRLLIDRSLLHNDDDDDSIVENSILVQRGTPVIHSGHTKDDEMAYCSRMASFLTQSRDLPTLCQSFPTVVRAVNQNRLADRDVMHQHHHHHQHYEAEQRRTTSTGDSSSGGPVLLAHSSIMDSINHSTGSFHESSLGDGFDFSVPTSPR